MTTTNGKNNISLSDIADEAMQARDFTVDFPDAVKREVEVIQAPALPRPLPSLRDLRNLLWVSIDNDTSKDLDQLTFAEKRSTGNDKIYVAVADVSALVQKKTATDSTAAHNTTSVYTPTKIYPMLPLKLSTDLTSLGEHVDRATFVVEMDVDSKGQFILAGIYPALVRNQAKLAYNAVAQWLDKKALPAEMSGTVPGLLEQLLLQDGIAHRIKDYRFRQGSLLFAEREMLPVLEGERVVRLEKAVHTRAHSLIENYMIAANVCMTRFLTAQKVPIIRRIVRTPKRWERIVEIAYDLGEKLPADPDVKALRDFLERRRQADPMHFPDLSLAIIKLIGRGEYVAGIPGETPLGHFDLAVLDYAHTTAPNRRYPDLVMQRSLKSFLYHELPPYTQLELLHWLHTVLKKKMTRRKWNDEWLSLLLPWCWLLKLERLLRDSYRR